MPCAGRVARLYEDSTTSEQRARGARADGASAPRKRSNIGLKVSGSRKGLAPQTIITIYTIGHSTRSLAEFIAILNSFRIELVCDIRTIPKSKRNPQFAGDTLQIDLAEHGIGYVHLKALGGLRHSHKDSPNTAWRNDSFRGYADYMQTPEFGEAVEDLIERAEAKRVVIMCAEAVPWRCHRSLVGDALLVRGVEVQDITSQTRAQAHKLTPWAKVKGLEITYPGEPA